MVFNGGSFESFVPSRGLRQRDLLSPALFIICSEVLLCLLLKEERAGRLQGFRICCTAPKVSYLLFADDLLLFAKANVKEAKSLDRSLQKYMNWSRQHMNRAKPFIHISKNFDG